MIYCCPLIFFVDNYKKGDNIPVEISCKRMSQQVYYSHKKTPPAYHTWQAGGEGIYREGELFYHKLLAILQVDTLHGIAYLTACEVVDRCIEVELSTLANNHLVDTGSFVTLNKCPG